MNHRCRPLSANNLMWANPKVPSVNKLFPLDGHSGWDTSSGDHTSSSPVKPCLNPATDCGQSHRKWIRTCQIKKQNKLPHSSHPLIIGWPPPWLRQRAALFQCYYFIQLSSSLLYVWKKWLTHFWQPWKWKGSCFALSRRIQSCVYMCAFWSVRLVEVVWWPPLITSWECAFISDLHNRMTHTHIHTRTDGPSCVCFECVGLLALADISSTLDLCPFLFPCLTLVTVTCSSKDNQTMQARKFIHNYFMGQTVAYGASTQTDHCALINRNDLIMHCYM